MLMFLLYTFKWLLVINSYGGCDKLNSDMFTIAEESKWTEYIML